MRTVWKVHVEWRPVIQSVSMPVGAQVVHVGTQPSLTGSQLCLWLDVETDARYHHMRRVIVVPTGGAIPDQFTHAGTVIEPVHGTVWHIYIHE